MEDYHSVEDLLKLCDEYPKQQMWEIIAQIDAKQKFSTVNEVVKSMQEMYVAMKKADSEYDKDLRSPSTLAGGDGAKMEQYNSSGRNICGEFMGMAMEKALKMGESNACMKRIVAAPTAGSCGVIPAVFISFEQCFHILEERMAKALIISAGIGKIIAENASIAGASGGCQAEIGSASAMAAAGLAYLQGGDNKVIVNACALALKNMLGLTCDPVCGLVEVPCIKRNVAGAVNAISSAQVAMAGIISAIPPDEVIDSMRRIGNAMPMCLKETGEGGLATTPTAIRIRNLL
ncbi:MAG: L-serine ammonia-lyase, iron-sulfur-dependent, subunit alpha [Lachnospira sp.]